MRLSECRPRLTLERDEFGLIGGIAFYYGADPSENYIPISSYKTGHPYWQIEDKDGWTIENLTITPSIRYTGFFHINITNGQIIDHGDK